MHRRLLTLLATVLCLAGAMVFMPFEIDTVAAQATAPWTVEYYNSANLTGAPVYTNQVNDVGFNWTVSAPAPGVNRNFFSARYTSVQSLDAGTYQISVQADDGVRVFVNNTPLIQEFHTSTGRTYTESFNVTAGQHLIQVEYYEGGGVAYLDFDLNEVGDVGGQSLAVVQAGRLNVRDAPSAITGTILAQVTLSETHPVIGRTIDSSWWQISADGVIGWVSGAWVNVSNPNDVPVTEGDTPEITGYTMTATGNLNIRSGPGLTYQIVGWLPVNQSARIIGRNADNSWWQIAYGNVTGWVSDVYSQLEFGVDINDIPVTSGIVPTQTLTATANLNIRSGPGLIYSIVGWLPYNQSVEIIGRNADNSWWQIEYGGTIGWVSGFYSNLNASADISEIPITG